MTQSQKSQTISRELGNIEPTLKPTKQSRGRNWVFTLNNYSPQEVIDMTAWIDNDCKDGGFSHETAPTTGTPHLQGFLMFKNQKYFNQIKNKFPRMWFKKMKGTKSQNLIYCSKTAELHRKLTWKEKLHAQLLKEYDYIVWKEWQTIALNHLQTIADSRTLLWFWEPTGDVGKSFLAKYIVLKYDCIIADGKKANIFNQVKNSLDNEKEPKIILLDIPRDYMEYVNYGVLEQLKGGLIYSGKYEGGTCAFHYPHVIVFANKPPNTHAVSLDRWRIIRL